MSAISFQTISKAYRLPKASKSAATVDPASKAGAADSFLAVDGISLEIEPGEFFRLIGESNPIAQFYVHPFTLSAIPRGEKAAAHIARYYEPFEKIRAEGLDALIITGANVSGEDLSREPFWGPLSEVIAWALERFDANVAMACSFEDLVLVAGTTRTVFGPFGGYFSADKRRWSRPDESAIRHAACMINLTA